MREERAHAQVRIDALHWRLLSTLPSGFASLPVGTDGAADDGAAEYVYRFAPLVGIYGGTLEVFRNMIAQYVLGLGKPNYSPPVQKKVS